MQPFGYKTLDQEMMENLALFSRQQLKELASSTSFDRGMAYYKSGSVRKVVRRGHTFEGKVEGSETYKVKLAVTGAQLAFDCSCPYDYEGICKHCVALGLAILDGQYKTEAAVDTGDRVNELGESSFTTYFEQADAAVKTDFLRALLSKDANLRSQFIQFVKGAAAPADKGGDTSKTTVSPSIDMLAIRQQVYQQLSGLSFDDLDYDTYDRKYDRYMESWEVADDIARQMIAEVLESYTQKAGAFIQKGALLDGFRVVLGIYEGIGEVAEPAADEYSIFDGIDYNETITEIFFNQVNELVIQLNLVVKSETAVEQVFNLLIERYRKYEDEVSQIDQERSEEKSTDEEQDDEEEEEEDDYYEGEERVFQYNLKLFEPLLLSLLTGPASARYLLDLLKQNRLINRTTAYIVMQIAEMTGDEALWIRTAEQVAEQEIPIARQLLDKYRTQEKSADFYRVAGKMLEQRPNEFDQYLLRTIKPEENRSLYVKALENYTKRSHSITHYRELRNYWTPAQRNTFLASQAAGFHHLFYAQLLAVEERFADALAFIRKNKFNVSGGFDEMIALIIPVYPTECLEMVIAKCDRELMGQGRNRGSYQLIAQWLKALAASTELKEEVKAYTEHLYNSKPILPALRDELNKAGLVQLRR